MVESKRNRNSIYPRAYNIGNYHNHVLGWYTKHYALRRLANFRGGIVAFLIFLLKQINKEKRSLLIYGFFVVFSLFLAFRVKGVLSQHYDNFSHWLVVVDEMLSTDSLPNFQSSMIMFQSYPTGSAGFIYFICKIVGPSNGVMLWGQGIMLVSCLCVFWVFIKRNYAIAGLVIILSSLFFLTKNISIFDLLVDTLLSLLGIASFAILLYYRKTPKTSAICSALLLTCIILVKNSGILFVAIHTLLLLIIILYENGVSLEKSTLLNDAKLLGIVGGIPLFNYFIWIRHVEYAFVSGTTAKHSMTLENYASIFRDKSAADIVEIFNRILANVFSFNEENFILFCLVSLYFLGMLINKVNDNRKNNELFYLIWSLVVYAVFLIGLSVMYLFSMPGREATSLAGYSRYIRIILLYIVGIWLVYCLQEINLWKKHSWQICISIPLVLFMLLYNVRDRIPSLLWERVDYSTTYRGKIITAKEKYSIPSTANCYVIYDGQNDSGYLYFLLNYEFKGKTVPYSGYPDTISLKNIVNQYDYLIVLDENTNFRSTLDQVSMPPGKLVYCLMDYRN